ncbi:uncharacterized protein LOC134253015 [Saccostrea cucullata]|uniref:uncharacterized protein LOC134253015 n=1 Tax=Saccostrea cuccullata TaxID=36930 RepID=UPI002ED621E2
MAAKKLFTGAHNGHRIIEIKDIVDEKKKLVEKDTAYLKDDIIPKLEKADTELESKLAALNAKCDKLEQLVIEHGDKWQRCVEEIVAKNKKDIADMRGNGIRKLKEYQKEVKNALESLNEIALQNEMIFQSMDVTVEIASFHTGITDLRRIACLNTEKVWVTGHNSKAITRINLQGSVQETVISTCPNHPSDISVSKKGHLLYTDVQNEVINDVHQTRAQIKALQGWKPVGLCCTQSGDILVSMRTSNYEQRKIIQYEGQTIKQEIEKDDHGHPLYKGGEYMLSVTENNNGVICVSDVNGKIVIVVNKAGILRFRYKGEQSKKEQFFPTSIVTDSAGRIIVRDVRNSCTHIIDQDGQFLRRLDLCGIMSLDTLGRLWVGQFESGNVKVITYTE